MIDNKELNKKIVDLTEQLKKDGYNPNTIKVNKKDLINFLIYETISIRNLKDLKRVYGLYGIVIKGIKK